VRRLVLLASAVLVAAAGAGRAQSPAGAQDHVAFTPTAVKWGPAPPALPPGAQMAVLEGDPSKDGPFVIRAKFPAGYKVPPHWHPTDEHLTVLQGVIQYGMGDTFDVAALHSYPAGSYVTSPKEMHHFVRAKGPTIIQLHAIGPFALTYVNPADDPRPKTQ
jgi:quercetin dioxygenase-like cupin family protein